MKTYGGGGGRGGAHLLDLGTTSRWDVSFKPSTLYCQQRDPPRYPLYIGGWADLRPGAGDTDKREFFHLPGLELRALLSTS
jgi:hypothetical protein